MASAPETGEWEMEGVVEEWVGMETERETELQVKGRKMDSRERGDLLV